MAVALTIIMIMVDELMHIIGLTLWKVHKCPSSGRGSSDIIGRDSIGVRKQCRWLI